LFQINRDVLAVQLQNDVTKFIQERMELIMREELQNFLRVEHPNEENFRNGYYQRELHTRYGKIEDLNVPRDREGEFHTALFEPYSRRENWLEEAVISMYKGGMSTRDIAQFIEKIYGTKYSPTTISNITNVVLADVDAWRKRPLKKRYSVLYMDGMYVSLKRDTVENESIYVVMGIDEQGHRQILGYYVGGQETAHSCLEVFQDLRQRGVEEVLIGVADGLPGLKETFLTVFPKADFQRCVVHKLRNIIGKVRAKDKPAVLEDLKGVYSSPTREEALACFREFEKTWNTKYPREVQSWRNDLEDLLCFYKYPEMIRYALYTTNAIERTIKEIRKRIRPMNSLANLEAAEKIVYLFSKGYNEQWEKRALRGFVDDKVSAQLLEMFRQRYPKSKGSEDKQP
jgi:putative transposase